MLVLVLALCAAVPLHHPGARAIPAPGLPVVWIPPTPHQGVLLGPPEAPVRVHLRRGYWMTETEITQDLLYRRLDIPLADCWTCQSTRGGSRFHPAYPAIGVTFAEAAAFADLLNAEAGLPPSFDHRHDPPRPLPHAPGWRLPTEWEWEWAARAGGATHWDGTSTPAEVCEHGNVDDGSARLADDVADVSALRDPRGAARDVVEHAMHPCVDGFPGLAPVRSFPANAWGLYDVTGNVFEWTVDPFRAGPLGSGARVVRGGAFLAARDTTPLYRRSARDVGVREATVGLRLVRDHLEPPRSP